MLIHGNRCPLRPGRMRKEVRIGPARQSPGKIKDLGGPGPSLRIKNYINLSLSETDIWYFCVNPPAYPVYE